MELGLHIDSFGLPLSQTVVLVFAALLIVLVTFVLHVRASRKEKGDTILLLGECGSGKTQLFLQLIHKKTWPTFTSMKEGEGKYTVDLPGKERIIRVVDFPGHQRLRARIPGFLGTTAVIVFVIDAVDLNIRIIAEHLYDLLVNVIVNKREIPFLIFCNKMDVVTAQASTTIQADLEKELNELRRTRQAALQEHGSKDQREIIYLGVEGKPFCFDQLQLDVAFAGGSVLELNFSSVVDFIKGCV